MPGVEAIVTILRLVRWISRWGGPRRLFPLEHAAEFLSQ